MLNCAQAYLRLRHVGPVQTIDAICPEYALLYLQDPSFLMSFPHEVPELLLDCVDLVHQIVQFVELIATGLRVKIEPNVLHVLLDEFVVVLLADILVLMQCLSLRRGACLLRHLQELDEALGQLVFLWFVLPN